jgi:hypothetical protein
MNSSIFGILELTCKRYLININSPEDVVNIKQLNLVDCRWSELSPWSKCSLTCGPGGIQTRSRFVVQPAFGEGAQPCEGGQIETRDCQDIPECITASTVSTTTSTATATVTTTTSPPTITTTTSGTTITTNETTSATTDTTTPTPTTDTTTKNTTTDTTTTKTTTTFTSTTFRNSEQTTETIETTNQENVIREEEFVNEQRTVLAESFVDKLINALSEVASTNPNLDATVTEQTPEEVVKPALSSE